jgi:hypothetical protein
MADEQPSTGGFSHSGKPRRDGFHDTLHPETGDRLLLTRVEASESKASVDEWAKTFALQEALGAVQTTAWWPVVRQGTEGDVAFMAFTPWKSTLSQDLAKGYRCNPTELVALAECLIDALNQLHSAAQRPHGALRPECIVFPKSSGDGHDSLAPRLTGLLPLDETDPRDHGDRRRAGHLLYAAITGAETTFRGVPDFGLAWSDVDLPGKDDWKKLIEDLTSGNLDNESYEQIRLRIGKRQGGKLPIIPIVAGLMVVAAGVGGFLMFKGRGKTEELTGGKGASNRTDASGLVASNKPTSNVVVVKEPQKTNPVVQTGTDPGPGTPVWVEAVRADKDVLQALGLTAGSSRVRLQNAIENWWKDLPGAQPGAWLRLDFPAPAALVLDAQAAVVLKAEVQRRRAYLEASTKLPLAQKDLAGEIDDWLASLQWGQKEIEALIRAQVTLGASNVLKSRTVAFSPGVDPSAEYPKALNGVTNAPQFNPARFKGWAKGWNELTAGQKAEATGNLRDVWRNDLVAWVNFEVPTLDGPEKASTELRNRATKDGVSTTTLDPFLKQASVQFAALDLQSRLRRYRSREEAQKALDDALRAPLADASKALNDAIKNVGDENARKARLAKEKKLQELDDSLTKTATTASRTQGGVRKARADLRSGLDQARVRDDAKELSFTFPSAERFYRDSEDAAWVEEAKATVDLKSTNSLAMVRSGLELKLRDKPAGGFTESRKLVGELKSEEVTLVRTLEDQAKKQAEEALRLATEADAKRAQDAATKARTDVAEALQTLKAQLKDSPGTITTRSTPLLKELGDVRDWLDLAAFRFTEAVWTPDTPPAPAGSGWEAKYPQVGVKTKAFQDSKAEWDAAIKAIPAIDQFKDASGFEAIKGGFSTPLLTGKPPFNQVRASLQSYEPLVKEGESLRTSKDTNALKAFIPKAQAQKPPYFATLAVALQGQMEQANKDAVAAAERAAAEAVVAEALRAKRGELETLKKGMVDAAKGAGGLTFAGTKYPRSRGVAKSAAKRWLTELDGNRAKYVALSSELDPSADKSKLDKELDDLKKALQEAIAFGD